MARPTESDIPDLGKAQHTAPYVGIPASLLGPSQHYETSTDSWLLLSCIAPHGTACSKAVCGR